MTNAFAMQEAESWTSSSVKHAGGIVKVMPETCVRRQTECNAVSVLHGIALAVSGRTTE
jgi:hypothetical protein